MQIPGYLVLASLGGTALYGLAALVQDSEVETLFSCPLPCTKDLFWDYYVLVSSRRSYMLATTTSWPSALQ